MLTIGQVNLSVGCEVEEGRPVLAPQDFCIFVGDIVCPYSLSGLDIVTDYHSAHAFTIEVAIGMHRTIPFVIVLQVWFLVSLPHVIAVV